MYHRNSEREQIYYSGTGIKISNQRGQGNLT